jgi:hypothetical protein
MTSPAKWTRSLLDADGSAGGTERLFDLAVGGKPVDVTIYQP